MSVLKTRFGGPWHPYHPGRMSMALGLALCCFWFDPRVQHSLSCYPATMVRWRRPHFGFKFLAYLRIISTLRQRVRLDGGNKNSPPNASSRLCLPKCCIGTTRPVLTARNLAYLSICFANGIVAQLSHQVPDAHIWAMVKARKACKGMVRQNCKAPLLCFYQ